MSRPLKSTKAKEQKIEEGNTPLPEVTDTAVPAPKVTETDIPNPEVTNKEIPKPKFGHPENCVQFGDDYIEIKPTLLKYQRDHTAAAYHILQQISVTEMLALQDGILDQNRSSDKVLFDWLIAVTNDPAVVLRNYDKLDSETIYKCLEIFCRLNHIKTENEKKAQAQMMTP